MRLVVPADAPRTVAATLDACNGATDMRIVAVIIALSVPVTIFATALWLRGNAPALAIMQAHSNLFTLQNHGELHLPAWDWGIAASTAYGSRARSTASGRKSKAAPQRSGSRAAATDHAGIAVLRRSTARRRWR